MPDRPSPAPGDLVLPCALQRAGEPVPDIVRTFSDPIRIPCRIVWRTRSEPAASDPRARRVAAGPEPGASPDPTGPSSDPPRPSTNGSNSPTGPSGGGVPVVLPDGSNVPGRLTLDLMSPMADLSPVAEAGRNAGNSFSEMLNNPETAAGADLYLGTSLALNLRQGGTFDYQRKTNRDGTFTQLLQYRDVSNFNVGLFSQQAGLSLDETLRIAGLYARFRSRNAKPDQPYGLATDTAAFIEKGYNVGASGIFGPAAHP